MPLPHDLPVPNKKALRRSNELADIIRKKIVHAGGVISFADYMQYALYHPTLGYYSALNFEIGAKGDFITAPLMTPLFAKCLVRQCVQIFSVLDEQNILELGAGTGTLAQDMLFEMKRLKNLPLHYYIYEISAVLRKKQQIRLQKSHPDFFANIFWLDELPVNFKGIIFANEVLDALPAHCFTLANNQVKERGVAINPHGQFTWATIAPTSSMLLSEVKKIQAECELPNGYQSEINLHLPTFVQKIMQSLTTGCVLFFDYGYSRQEYYHPERNLGTLTSFFRHHQINNPFMLPGLLDISIHVDFTRVIESAQGYETQLLGFTSQAAFLLSLGLMDFAIASNSAQHTVQEIKMNNAIKQLVMPMEMGERIKVMALTKNLNLPLLGFQLKDRRHEL